jgi:hypothetical protein
MHSKPPVTGSMIWRYYAKQGCVPRNRPFPYGQVITVDA